MKTNNLHDLIEIRSDIQFVVHTLTACKGYAHRGWRGTEGLPPHIFEQYFGECGDQDLRYRER